MLLIIQLVLYCLLFFLMVKAAVKDNGMDWIHVSTLGGFDNQAAKDYAVQAIPTNLLIDREGRIVAKNLRGEALYEKIGELLK